MGAEVLRQGGVHFRVWATRCQRVTVVIEPGGNHGAPLLTVALMPERNGYFSGVVPFASTGMSIAMGYMRRRTYIQTQPRVFSLMDRMALLRSSIQIHSSGLIMRGQAFASRDK